MKEHAHTRNKLTALLTVLFLLAAAALSLSGRVSAQKMKPEEVIAKHLDAIGKPEARAAMKSRIIQGTALATFRLGGTGTAQGGAVIASTGNKYLFSIVYGNEEYPFERAGFDGKTVHIAEIKPGVRTTLGKFFQQYEMPLKEGLLGGVLSSAWPFYDVEGKKVKVKYAGMKKVGERQAHMLEYEAKNSSGLKTRLYFDAETFRHIRTEYERRTIQQMPDQPSVTQDQGDSITRLTEDFSDFKEEGGVMLPHTYKLTYALESLNRRALQDWVFTLTKFDFNLPINDSEFDVRTSTKKS